MKLRKLIVSGFKSFADKTEFEFDDGVSCVVGPNGCGKSNVVDAIKWVLGEQSAKSLRGGEMLDVIFNGSAARKPSGCASVTLVFDNSDGTLQPLVDGKVQATEEVSITRRLYRSGQSEYLINKQPARLRDIKEMFLDTGIGAGAYSIIEQGRVSQFLQASQDERRAFFDEAAGISRYKQRKKEAMRKLDRVEQNLLRLQDIVSEVEKRLRSVKYQAGKARNYQEYTQRLKELRSLHFLSRFHRLKGDRVELQKTLEAGTDELSGITARIHQLEQAQSATEAEAGELERTSRDVQSRLATLTSQIASLLERAEMQAARAEELGHQLLENAQRIEELEARIDDAAKDAAAAEAELDAVAAEVTELQGQCDAVREEYAAGDLDISRLAGELDSEKAGVTDILRRTTHLHNEVHQIGLKKQGLDGQRQRLAGRAEEIAQLLEGLFVAEAEHKTRLSDIEEVIAESTTKLDEVRAQAESVATAEQDLATRRSEAKEQRSAVQSRLHTLDEMQKRLEGVADGPRKVLQARQDGRLACIRGMLGDFLETDTEHAPLVEAALAGADQRLIAAHYAEVASAAETVEDVLGDHGSIEVICLDRVQDLPTQDAVELVPQAVGRVLDWIRYDAWLEPTLWHLLGRTFVVRTLAEGRLAADVAPEGYRFVTLAGEVLEADGRVRLGSACHTAGIIARRSELAELRERLDELQAEIERLDAECSDVHEQREHLDQQIHTLRTAIYEANYEKSETSKKLANVTSQVEEQQRNQPLIAQDLQDVETQIEDAVRREHEAREKSEELEQVKVEHEQAIERLERELAEAREAQAARSDLRTELKVALASAEQKSLSLNERARTLRRQADEMQTQLDSARGSVDVDRQRKAQAEEEAQQAQLRAGEMQAEQGILQEEAAELEESRAGQVERLEEIRTQLAERRKAAEGAQGIIGDLRVRLSELEAHIGDLINRATDEMGMNLTELAAKYEHDEERNWDEVEAEINELRGKIERLGNVNLDAIGEQDELEQRQTFLAEQLGDIEGSQRQLEELIRKLNKESRDRFVETFTAVRENFIKLFRKLFGGGKADIVLTDPEDVLESGIEIMARPPGKELRSISLLSGGEKTMAALAMIFAFFEARPSPFCLLDEVDAALDEANTMRYNDMVAEFLAYTQFIMISHAKRTMAMANVLYGVTMQEPGVSKRISVRFEEATQIAEEAAVGA